MLDIGFWELTAIAVVALVVIGPERLPQAARSLGIVVGKIRAMVSNFKTEVEQELKASDGDYSIQKEFSNMAKKVGDTKQYLQSEKDEIEHNISLESNKTADKKEGGDVVAEKRNDI